MGLLHQAIPGKLGRCMGAGAQVLRKERTRGGNWADFANGVVLLRYLVGEGHVSSETWSCGTAGIMRLVPDNGGWDLDSTVWET